MKIAYVSYEYPPDTAVGGIATYVHQAARLMQSRGHHVEVFCASEERTVSEEEGEVQVHRIKCTDRAKFAEDILPVFALRHQQVNFDVIESPEFSGDGLAISNAYPTLPLIVKLHTPWFLINQMNNKYLTIFWKAKYLLYWLYKEHRLRDRFWVYHREQDPDYLLTIKAHLITTPSLDLGRIVAKTWDIPVQEIVHIPYPFIPKQEMLNIPVVNTHRVITFLGRLEIRKGILDLCKAIPLVLRKHPDWCFRLVGKPDPSPVPNLNMAQYIKREYADYLNNIQLVGKVAASEIPNVLANTAICVFPSIWENFPNVCLEAMSAGRAIVATKTGGMQEMLDDEAGLLVEPNKPEQIAAALIEFIENKERRFQMGAKARQIVLERYNKERIGKMMEQHYALAIQAV